VEGQQVISKTAEQGVYETNGGDERRLIPLARRYAR
jgi:hypothetical protein